MAAVSTCSSLPPSTPDIDSESGISIARINHDCAPDDSKVFLNGSLTLQCFPPSGLPMVNVTWYLNGNKLRAKDDPTIDFSNSRRYMTISPFSGIHDGTYHCEAANTVNQDSPLRSEEMLIELKCKWSSCPPVSQWAYNMPPWG